VDVVTHQAITQNTYARVTEIFLHQLEIGSPIQIDRKHFPTVNSSLGNMARYIRQ